MVRIGPPTRMKTLFLVLDTLCRDFLSAYDNA